jgi:soluble lytic murein transglycosylase-like protein
MGKTERASAAREAVRVLARKWGMLWDVPASWIEAFCVVESSCRPDVSNTNERASKVGGAWGLMQITGDTSPTLARLAYQRQAIAPAPELQTALAKWRPDPRCLLDADLCVCLGAAYLAKLAREFTELPAVAAAYHQGPGRVRRHLREGKVIPGDLPPLGRVYVSRLVTTADDIRRAEELTS